MDGALRSSVLRAMNDPDLDLLRRFEPIVRFNEGEYFLPASVESFVGRAELWERTGPSSTRMVAPAGSLDLDTLVDLTEGHLAQHFLRLVSSRPSKTEFFGWQHRRDRPRFRPETREWPIACTSSAPGTVVRTRTPHDGRV